MISGPCHQRLHVWVKAELTKTPEEEPQEAEPAAHTAFPSSSLGEHGLVHKLPPDSGAMPPHAHRGSVNSATSSSWQAAQAVPLLECCVIGSLLGSRRTPRAISQKRNCLSKRACFARKPRRSHCTSLTWLGQRLNTAVPLASSGLHALAREESLCQINGGVTGCRGCVNWLQKREKVWGRSCT